MAVFPARHQTFPVVRPSLSGLSSSSFQAVFVDSLAIDTSPFISDIIGMPGFGTLTVPGNVIPG